MRKGPLENHVESYLVKKVEGIGGMALKGDIKGRRFIDRICILPGGETWYVECKRPQGGVYSAHQVETMGRLTDLGHYTVGLTTRDAVDEWFAQVTATPAPETHADGYRPGDKVRVKDTGETGMVIRCPLVVQADEEDGTQGPMGGTVWVGEFEPSELERIDPSPQTREVGS